MKLSVIIPIYNAEKYLHECLDSVCNQNMHDMEIICINDGSIDGSQTIIDKFCSDDARVKCVKKENGGLVSARLAGLSVARGEYCTFVDADDWVENKYQKLEQIANQYNPDVICTGVIRDYDGQLTVDLGGVDEGFYEGDRLKMNIKSRMIDIDNFMTYNVMPHLVNKWIKKDLLQRNYERLPKGTSIDEDAASSYPIILESNSVYVCKDAYYHYCSRVDSMMNSISEKQYEGLVGTYSYLESRFKEYENSASDIMRQFEQLKFYSFMFIRPEVVVSYKNGELYPYGKIEPKSKVVLYGMGSFAKPLISYLSGNTDLEIVALADAMGDGDEIKTIDQIKSIDFDYVIISVVLKNVVDRIKMDLINNGVEDRKILYLWSDNN